MKLILWKIIITVSIFRFYAPSANTATIAIMNKISSYRLIVYVRHDVSVVMKIIVYAQTIVHR